MQQVWIGLVIVYRQSIVPLFTQNCRPNWHVGEPPGPLGIHAAFHHPKHRPPQTMPISSTIGGIASEPLNTLHWTWTNGFGMHAPHPEEHERRHSRGCASTAVKRDISCMYAWCTPPKADWTKNLSPARPYQGAVNGASCSLLGDRGSERYGFWWFKELLETL